MTKNKTVMLGLPAWKWLYCPQSGLSFQVGFPFLDKSRNLRKNPFVDYYYRVKGQMGLHVCYAHWQIFRHRTKILDRLKDPTDQINAVTSQLDGILILSIDIHHQGWVKSAKFDGGITLKITPIEPPRKKDFQSIANWLVRI